MLYCTLGWSIYQIQKIDNTRYKKKKEIQFTNGFKYLALAVPSWLHVQIKIEKNAYRLNIKTIKDLQLIFSPWANLIR